MMYELVVYVEDESAIPRVLEYLFMASKKIEAEERIPQTTEHITITREGEVTSAQLLQWQPEVFPLDRVVLEPPIFVMALKKHGEIHRLNHYYIDAVYKDGQVHVIAGRELHPMEMFVRLVKPDAQPPQG